METHVPFLFIHWFKSLISLFKKLLSAPTMCQVFGQCFGDMTFEATDIVSELMERLDSMFDKI